MLGRITRLAGVDVLGIALTMGPAVLAEGRELKQAAFAWLDKVDLAAAYRLGA